MADTTDTVPVWDPNRSDIVDVPKNVADNLVATGYHYKTGDDALREQTDEGVVGKASATAHSWLNSFTFGGADLAAANVPSALGGDAIREGLKRVHHQEQLHPNYATAGDIAGYLGPGGLLHIAGKGAEKAGMHALLKAAAEHTPQHLAQNLGLDIAAKHELGEGLTRLAGKAGSAVGFGAEQGIRGAARADVDEQLYDTQYDVEKVYQAFGHDALTGFAADAAFGAAGEGLRGLRKGVSKTADYAQKIFPSKTVKDGASEVKEGFAPKTVLKRTHREVKKEKNTERTGGGWEQRDTYAKATSHDSELDETSTRTENRVDNLFDKKTNTTEKPKPGHTVQYKENVYANDKRAEEPMGFAWDKNAKPHEVVATVRTMLDDLVKGDKTDLEFTRKIMEHEADYQQAVAENRHGDAFRLRRDKDEYTDYLTSKYPDYGPLLQEYKKAMAGKVETFDAAKEVAQAEKAQKGREKVGTKTTTYVTGQEPGVLDKEHVNNQDHFYEEKKTRTRRNQELNTEEVSRFNRMDELDSEEKQKERIIYNDKFEPITYMTPKKEYIKKYKTEYQSKIPGPVRYGLGYAAHVTSTHGAVWPTLAADAVAPHILNNRKFYSQQLDRVTQPIAKATGTLLRNLTTSKLNSDYSDTGKFSRHLRNPDKLYNQVTQALKAQAGDPGATQQLVQHHWQHALVEHPQLQTGLILQTQKVAQHAQSYIPPDNRPPTAQHTPYNPPRSQKVKFLRLFHAMNQPLAALNNPTPQIVQAIADTNPETLALVQRAIAGHIAQGGKPFTGQTAKVVSMIMQQSINPKNDPAYLRRLQQTATLDNPPTQPSGGNMAGPHAGSIAGPKSAKVQQDAAMLYATPQQLQSIA